MKLSSRQSTRLLPIDKLFSETLEECYEKAKAILLKNEKILKNLIAYLAEKQLVQEEQCEVLLEVWGGIQN